MTNRGPHCDADKTIAVPELHYKQFLHLISCERYCGLQVISSCLYICSKGTCSLASRALLNTGE